MEPMTLETEQRHPMAHDIVTLYTKRTTDPKMFRGNLTAAPAGVWPYLHFLLSQNFSYICFSSLSFMFPFSAFRSLADFRPQPD